MTNSVMDSPSSPRNPWDRGDRDDGNQGGTTHGGQNDGDNNRHYPRHEDNNNNNGNNNNGNSYQGTSNSQTRSYTLHYHSGFNPMNLAGNPNNYRPSTSTRIDSNSANRNSSSHNNRFGSDWAQESTNNIVNNRNRNNNIINDNLSGIEDSAGAERRSTTNCRMEFQQRQGNHERGDRRNSARSSVSSFTVTSSKLGEILNERDAVHTRQLQEAINAIKETTSLRDSQQENFNKRIFDQMELVSSQLSAIGLSQNANLNHPSLSSTQAEQHTQAQPTAPAQQMSQRQDNFIPSITYRRSSNHPNMPEQAEASAQAAAPPAVTAQPPVPKRFIKGQTSYNPPPIRTQARTGASQGPPRQQPEPDFVSGASRQLNTISPAQYAQRAAELSQPLHNIFNEVEDCRRNPTTDSCAKHCTKFGSPCTDYC